LEKIVGSSGSLQGKELKTKWRRLSCTA